MKIYELENEQFYNSEIINSYISNTREKKIAYLNKVATNSKELSDVFDSADWLNNEKIVVFGENIPEGECGFIDTIACVDMNVVAMVIDKDVFVETGSLNEKLKCYSHYEFLVRASKLFNIYYIPVSSDNSCTVPDANPYVLYNAKTYRELSYILRSNVNELKAVSQLENVLNSYRHIAVIGNNVDDFDSAVNNMLSDDEDYADIYRNTSCIFVISGDDTCNGVLKGFADNLSDALVNMGQRVITSSGRYGNPDDFYLRKDPICKGVIGFQSVALEGDFIRHIDAKKIQIWFDHPAFFCDMFKELGDSYYVLSQDEGYANYLRKYMNVKNAFHFPLAGIDIGMADNEVRPYELVFVGTYNKVESTENYDEMGKTFWQFMISHPKYSFEEGLTEVLNQLDVSVDNDVFSKCLASLHPICKNVINYFRNKVIETILSAGISIDVFGDSWKEYDGKGTDNLIIHPLITVEKSLKVWGQSKIGLNIMSWHKSGMTERVANIMLSGAVCLSDETTYLRENFDASEISLFSLDKLEELPGIINTLLNDKSKRQYISKNAYDKAKDIYVWEEKAREILYYINK